MANSITGSLNMYFPAQVTVNYNPKEINTSNINCWGHAVAYLV
jgi:hypothetical protein